MLNIAINKIFISSLQYNKRFDCIKKGFNVDKKKLFREASKKKIEIFSKSGKLKRDKIVVEKLRNYIRVHGYKNILLYIPLKTEVDTMQLIKKIRAKTNIFVPFMEGISFKW